MVQNADFSSCIFFVYHELFRWYDGINANNIHSNLLQTSTRFKFIKCKKISFIFYKDMTLSNRYILETSRYFHVF